QTCALPICAKIKIRLRREAVRNLGIRRIRRLLGPTLPRCPRFLALLPHRLVELWTIEENARISACVLYEIDRQAESVVELECFATLQNLSTLADETKLLRRTSRTGSSCEKLL